MVGGYQLFTALRLDSRPAREDHQRSHCPDAELESVGPGRRHERMVEIGATAVVGAGEAPGQGRSHIDAPRDRCKAFDEVGGLLRRGQDLERVWHRHGNTFPILGGSL